jgi:CDP-diacylglycerol pyrophosphatase
MTSRSFLGGLLLLGACGGGGLLYTTLTATPAAGPPDVFECVRTKLSQLEYQQTSIDLNDRRIVARNIDDKATRPDTQFRRLINRLEIQANAGADGRTQLKVVAHTFGDYFTSRGPTEIEEEASAEVKQDAQAVIEACGQ